MRVIMINKNFKRLPLKNVFNVRELGGYPINSHDITKWHTFIRSADLVSIDDSEKDLLYNYGIRTIIDLRCEFEKQYFKNYTIDEDKRFIYKNITLIDDFNNFTGSMYLAILNIFAKYVKKVFCCINEHIKYGGILFHCVSGKDRTGVISALLLLLAEVSELDVIADYMVSAIYLRPDAVLRNRPIETLQSNPESIEEMLKFIKTNYGTAKNYLLQIGVSESVLSSIRNAFI
jgi:protein-tyrosine phosphatase